jgi:hypothetical protein
VQCPIDLGLFKLDVCTLVANQLKTSLATAAATVRQLVVAGIPGKSVVIFGLAVVRTLLGVLSDFHIGVNAVVQGNIKIGLEFRTLVEVVDMLERYVLPTHVPSIADALECQLYVTAPMDLIACWMKLNGATPEVWDPVVDARREKLTPEQTIQWHRRLGDDEKTQIESLRELGFTRENEARRFVYLYDELPSVADNLHYLQRNVFDVNYVNDYDLLEGFEDRYWANFGLQLSAIGRSKEVSRLDYAAHWVLPPPTQLSEFVYRLRPDKPGVQNPVTLQDYERLLAEQDVAPWARKRYAEIVHRVPALGYVRDMFRSYILDADELKSIHQDLGYTAEDSDRFVRVDTLFRARIRASESHGWTPAAVGSAYVVGRLTKPEALDKIKALGFTDTEASDSLDRAQADFYRMIVVRARSRVMFKTVTTVQQGVESGLMSDDDATKALVGLGWPEDFASSFVDVLRSGQEIKLIKTATGRIKRAFLAGEIDANYAITALQNLNIQGDQIQLFISVWAAEMTPNRKRRSAKQITQDVAEGYISTAEALVKLQNLGYENADQILFLADSAQAILKREQQSLSVEFKTEAQLAQALAQQIAAGGRQSQQLRNALRRFSSPATMDKWAKAGQIEKSEYVERMTLFGFSPDDIERQWQTACSAKGAACLPG